MMGLAKVTLLLTFWAAAANLRMLETWHVRQLARRAEADGQPPPEGVSPSGSLRRRRGNRHAYRRHSLTRLLSSGSDPP